MSEEIKNHLASLENRIQELENQKKEKKVCIILQSGTLDKAMSAMILSMGAVSLGYSVSVFFTFWGLNALKKGKVYKGKKFIEKLMTMMGPGNSKKLPITHNNFFGLGAKMMRNVMKQKGCASLEDLFDLCKENKVKFIACDMTCQIMNIGKEELVEGVESAGVINFFEEASKSSLVLFI